MLATSSSYNRRLYELALASIHAFYLFGAPDLNPPAQIQYHSGAARANPVRRPHEVTRNIHIPAFLLEHAFDPAPKSTQKNESTDTTQFVPTHQW